MAWRALGAVLVPLALLLCAATVYGQLHYAVDAVAGAAIAAAVLTRVRSGSATH
jgi:membrane-associated phospholipid phosphatase